MTAKEDAYGIYHISSSRSFRSPGRQLSATPEFTKVPHQRPCCERAVGNPQVHKTSHWDFGFWWDSTEACSRPSLQNNRKPNIKSLVIKLTDDKDLRSSQVQLVNEADLNPGRLRIAKSKLKYLRICNTCLRMGLPWKSLTEGNVKGF